MNFNKILTVDSENYLLHREIYSEVLSKLKENKNKIFSSIRLKFLCFAVLSFRYLIPLYMLILICVNEMQIYSNTLLY